MEKQLLFLIFYTMTFLTKLDQILRLSLHLTVNFHFTAGLLAISFTYPGERSLSGQS